MLASQYENRMQNVLPLKKMTTMLVSQHENSKQKRTAIAEDDIIAAPKWQHLKKVIATLASQREIC